MSRRDLAVSSVLLGAASGLRSQIAVAVVVAGADARLPALLRRPWVRRAVIAAAAGEVVGDKLPMTPSRLAPPGLIGRLVLGALAASLHARTRRAPWPAEAAIGASAAALAAKVGHDLRADAARHAPDAAVAALEDELALLLAAAGARR